MKLLLVLDPEVSSFKLKNKFVAFATSFDGNFICDLYRRFGCVGYHHRIKNFKTPSLVKDFFFHDRVNHDMGSSVNRMYCRTSNRQLTVETLTYDQYSIQSYINCSLTNTASGNLEGLFTTFLSSLSLAVTPRGSRGSG